MKDAEARIEWARKQLGYRAQPNRESAFSATGFRGSSWNGSFLNRMLLDTGSYETSFVSTVAALGYYAARNRLYRKPRVGDIVFFTFSSDPTKPFEQPHVGLVTDVSAWKTRREFRTVEAEIDPGVPQGSHLADGVFERTRYEPDILAVVRPVYRKPKRATVDASEKIRPSYFQSNAKTRYRAAERLQRGLARAGFGKFSKGRLDGLTRSAFAAYARNRGFVKNRGEIEFEPLEALEFDTGEYKLEP